MENTIKIEESKIMSWALLIGSFTFIGLAIFYLVFMGPNHDLIVYLFYGAGVVFFGYCASIAIRKLFRGKGGVEIDSQGITFYTYNLERNLIRWSEIADIDEYSVVDQRFISIFLKFPDFYIEKQRSRLNKGLMKLNNGMAGSPIQISANTLDITHEELLKLLQERLDKSKRDSGFYSINSNLDE